MSLPHKRIPKGSLHLVPASSREVARLLWKGGVDFVLEQQVVPDRRFRHDFYLPGYNIAIEVEGGIFAKSRHTSFTGFSKDCIKYGLSQARNGTYVYRTTTDHATIRKVVALVLDHCANLC